MKKRIVGIFLIFVIFLGFNICPAIKSIKSSNILEKEKNIDLDKNNFDILDFMNKMKNQNAANSDEVFYEIIKHLNLKINNIGPSLLLYNFLCDRIKNKIGTEEYNNFLSFLDMTLQYLNTNNMTIIEFHSSFNKEVKLITKELDYVLDGTNLEYDFFNNIKELLDVYTINEDNSKYLATDNFEKYWDVYTRGKCYWAGHIPKLGEQEPNPDLNLNQLPIDLISLWRGDDFYEWSNRSINFIFGEEGSPDGTAPFWMLNKLLFAVFIGIVCISVPVYMAGIHEESIVKLSLSGGLAIIGIVVLGLISYYDWLTLVYFLLGTNAYFECQRYGNVEFMVHVINETGCEINTSCTVIARSVNAFNELKKGDPYSSEDFDVTWSNKEFEYKMEKVANDNSGYNIFCLQCSSKSPEKWEKAVPPSGMWNFTVSAIGYQTITDSTPQIDPGECFNITIILPNEER